MKKIIAITLAVLALSALAVTAFAASSSEQDAAAPAAEETMIETALTEEQALAAALKAAGEKEADVTVTQNKLSEKETTDGESIAVYTVEFSTETTTYKYILDANTGEIYYSSVEFQNPDVIFKVRDRGEGRGEASGEMGEGGRSDKANGEKRGRASGEMDAEAGGGTAIDGTTGASVRQGGRGGSRQEASAEPAAESVTA